MFKRSRIFLLALFLGACATYGGSALKPGEARLEDVVRVMGEPAMRWREPDGAVQLAYPKGPWGVDSFMVYLEPEGRLRRIENVMGEHAFARIHSGMSKEQVLRTLGPSYPGWTEYFKARDELVWEWRYCDQWNAASRFDVLFDGTAGTVRSTQSRPEFCGKGYCPC